jgi:hypothetical protein
MNLRLNKSLTLRFQKVVSSKALAILLLIASISPNLFAANLLLDGSFENVSGVPANGYSLFTGDIGDGWVVTQNEILIERGTLNGVPHTGNQLAYLDGNLGFNTLSQTIPTTPGLAYMISLWVADSNPNLLQIAFAGQSLFNGTAPASGGGFPATGWVQETFIATATSTTSTLSISGQWTGGTGTVLDDVSVQVVPEPASVSLLCCALASRFALRRRSCNPPRCT